MTQAIQAISLVVYGTLTVAALVFAVRQRSRAATWAGATFLDLGLIVLLGAVTPEGDPGPGRLDGAALFQELVVLLLVVFPYLTLRFVRALRGTGNVLDRIVDAALALLVLWTLIAPPFPVPGGAEPTWVLAYRTVFIVWWGVVFGAVTWQLWRMGKAQPGVVRGRMRLMSVAALLMNLALLASILGTSPDATDTTVVELVSALLGWASAGLFLLGLQPSPSLRRLWRSRDEAELRHAENELISARTAADAATAIVGAAAWLVGGSAGLVSDPSGETLARTGRRDAFDARALTVRGSHSVVTVSPGRLTPLLGQGEEALLEQLCAHLDLALTRIEALAISEAARRDAEQANVDLQQLVYGVSHDLRNPLVTITGFLNLLAREPELSERSSMLIDRVQASAGYMEGLVSDLLQLSRVGHADSEREHVDLRRTIDSITEDLTMRYPHLSVDLGELPSVHMNKVRARQLFLNLVENAARYARPVDEPVQVTISATVQDDMAVVEVADDGEGIPEDQRERVFQIFQRLGRFDSGSDGSGIGLTMCRRIVADVGGTIHVADSTGGTTMRLSLPLSRSEIPAAISVEA